MHISLLKVRDLSRPQVRGKMAFFLINADCVSSFCFLTGGFAFPKLWDLLQLLERTRRVYFTVGESAQCPQGQAIWISSVDERKDTLLILAQQFGLISSVIALCYYDKVPKMKRLFVLMVAEILVSGYLAPLFLSLYLGRVVR